MSSEKFEYLVNKCLDQTLTAEERLELQAYLLNEEYKEKTLYLFESNLTAGNNNKIVDDQTRNEILNSIFQAGNKRVFFLQTAWFKYAAAILLLISGITFFRIATKTELKTDTVKVESNIEPVNNNAVLTLSNGKQVILNDSAIRQITDGKMSIDQQKGIISYNKVETVNKESAGKNIMTTPRGGQFQVVLPDGSTVWLNSVSSLKYPVVFNENNRVVELNGEAYFEIKENKKQPFIVKTNNLQIAVLGTEFNVNSYVDEPFLSTTLVNGAVKVNSGNKVAILTPKQQAAFNYADGSLKVNNPKMEEVLAWKNGKFKFNNVNIQVMMRQIARWYDVNVEYHGPMPSVGFSGSLLRTESPIALLKALELTDKVYFKIEKKKIIVYKGQKPKQ